MRIARTIPLALLVLASACESAATAPDPSGAAFAKAGTITQNQWIDVTGGTVYSECTDETVVVSGKGHVRTTMTSNPDGSTLVKTHINYASISGVGPSGIKYQVVAAAKQEGTTTIDPYTYSYETKQQAAVISNGPTGNYKQFATVTYGFDGTDYYYLTIRENIGCGE